MGLKSYFMLPKAKQPTNKPTTVTVSSNRSAHTNSSYEAHTPDGSSPWTSRPASRITDKDLTDIKCQIMVSWLHQQQIEKTWFDSQAHDEGVVLKKCKGEYVCCPESLGDQSGEFCRAVEHLNVRVSLLYHILLSAAVRICTDHRSPPSLSTPVWSRSF
jgi:hypothetical protein